MTEERGQWGKQVEFILSMIGYAVGLGNVWRFPYLCYKHGGGAFLIPYVCCLFLLGIPTFALECSFGQFGGRGPLTIWSMNPAFKGLGMSMVCTASIIFIYYDVIISWSLRYLVASFTSTLPWVDCGDCECLLYNQNLTDGEVEDLKYNNSLGIECLNLNSSDVPSSPSELYFLNDVLRDSGTIEEAGDIVWELMLGNFVAYVIIFLVLVKGIQSLGKVVYFTATFPYVLLTIFLVRTALLDGAYDGVMFYLEPDWDSLTDAEAWSDAAVQIFFSLSACVGGLVALSSYNRFDNNVIRDAFTIPVINCLTSFYSGFIVFCTLGNMAHIKNVPIDNVTEGGPGLAFVVYPEAIGTMPTSTLWSILFFFMLCILGFSTQFSAAETIMTSITDEFPKFLGTRSRQMYLRLSVVILAFILGLPLVTQGGQHLLDLVDSAVLGFPVLIIGLTEYLVIIHIYGYQRFAEDIYTMLGFRPFLYLKITWCVTSPILLFAVIVFQAYQKEDYDIFWVGLIYYLIVIFIVLWIPAWFFFYTCRNGLWELMKPQKEWTDRRHHGSKETNLQADENGTTLEKGQGFAEYTMLVDGDSPRPGLDNPSYFLKDEEYAQTDVAVVGGKLNEGFEPDASSEKLTKF